MNNKYYHHYDFFNMTSKDLGKNGFLISNFLTKQQETDENCAPACAIMILNYYKDNRFNETTIAKMMKTKPFPKGTSFKNIIGFLTRLVITQNHP